MNSYSKIHNLERFINRFIQGLREHQRGKHQQRHHPPSAQQPKVQRGIKPSTIRLQSSKSPATSNPQQQET